MIKKALSIAVLVALGLLIFGGARAHASALKMDISEISEMCYVLLDDVPLEAKEQLVIQEASYKNNVDYRLAMALLESESHYTWVTGDLELKHHAIGYFQISTVNADRMAEDYGLDIYDPEGNLKAGVTILGELLKKFPNGYGKFTQEQAAIMCYKCGCKRGTDLMDVGFLLGSVDEIIGAKSNYDL